MLRILVDEDMPRPTSQMLVSLGVDAVDARDAGLKGSSDANLFRYAQREKRIILTRDKEFANILRYPSSQHCGIILVRVPFNFTRDQILDLVKLLFARVEQNRLQNSLTILEVNNCRIRGSSVSLTQM